ncbi:YHYH protein [Hahella ganghwensis]|uniref:YHYH protein n=1 Tax=Hahella ganghwensis TaxID=286420 RepID=UPI000366FF69|nr:YHYH protein [Hahella ganghwensis]
MRAVVSSSILILTGAFPALSMSDSVKRDITDVILTDRIAQCDHYVGSYFSNVRDIKRAKGFSGDITITADSRYCYIRSNDIPNHDFNDHSAHFATNVSEQNLSFRIPLYPANAHRPTALSLGTTEAVLLNGVVVDLLAAACYDVGREPLGREKMGCTHRYADHPWRYDPMSPINDFGTDAHNAHTQPNGKYHYHGNPLAMFYTECSKAESASPVIGYAADGFPVYGSCIRDPATGDVREAKSSYRLKNGGGPRQPVSGYTTPREGVGVVASNNYDGQFRGDYEFVAGTGDLDECNGMTVNGQYGYYITNAFPWVNNCFKGKVDSSFNGREQQRMHRHQPGKRPEDGPNGHRPGHPPPLW